jgi:hypothetical protein
MRVQQKNLKKIFIYFTGFVLAAAGLINIIQNAESRARPDFSCSCTFL